MRVKISQFLSLLFTCFIVWQGSVSAEDFLPPEEAFKITARMTDGSHVQVHFTIADGYYLYREQLGFSASGATLGDPVIPEGKVKFDENFGKDVETYRESLAIALPVQANQRFELTVRSQGCADKGLCYPPMDNTFVLSPDNTSAASVTQEAPVSDVDGVVRALQGRDLLVILPLFLLMGLGLSFTPCVLPMMPILSSIIVGRAGKQTSKRHGFMLALSYSLGMALVYTILGVAAGLIGEGLSASLQKPWVLSVFALLMVGLALSMFNLYELQMPSMIQSRLTQASGQMTSGRVAGVFGMGALSALIVGPCVAAPLAGILVYISQTKDAVLGGVALFTLAAGMSVPLLLIGISAGSLLPKAGNWMESIKRFFGVLMLGTALWMVTPILPGWLVVVAWGVLGAGYGLHLLLRRQGKLLSKVFGVVFLALGLMQLVSVAMGGRDVLRPWHYLSAPQEHGATFTRIRSSAELDMMLARYGDRPMMLDFYADWCVSCIEMERYTFTDLKVKAQMDHMVLLQIDVTQNNADDRQMLRRFGLFGPPAIIMFGKDGQEVRALRVVGFQDARRFEETLNRLAGS